FVALLLQNQLLHEAADAVEDAGGDVRTTLLELGNRGAALLAAGCGAVVIGALVRILGSRHLPLALAVGALPVVVVFPALLARFGGSPARMARARIAQRWAAVATGALLIVLLR